ncbi:hypothetical protein HYY69_03665 [Candidatus Woesearchaeota archaeon]|nr:hypothetical protein [Candidatus Woesearchaeota archaeon]
MGLFNRFKAFLARKEAVSEIIISGQDLENWINQQSSEAVLVLDKRLEEIYNQLAQEISSLKQNISNLQKAQLMNENIVVKAKQIMEGNRETYIKRLLQFIDKLDVTNKGYFSAKNLMNLFEAELALFLEATPKNYYVLQEFFAHEAKAITNNIQNIGKEIIMMKGLIQQSNVDELYAAKNLLKEISDKKRLVKEKESLIAQKKKEIHELLLSREKVEQKLESLKRSDVFAEFNSLTQKRDLVLKAINDIDKNLYEKFSVLDRPLRKYAHEGSYDELIAKYLVHATTALVEDEKFELLIVLEQVKTAVEQDAVALKDKQKEKVIEIIKMLNRDELLTIKKQYLTLRAEKQDLEKRIKVSSLQQDYNELRYKIEHYHNKSKRLIEEINELERTMYQTHIDQLQKKINETLHKFNSQIKVDFTPQQQSPEKKKGENKDNNDKTINDTEKSDQLQSSSPQNTERPLQGTTVEIVLDETALKELNLDTPPASSQKNQ